MTPTHQSKIYQPSQPLLENVVTSFSEARSKGSPLFNGGLIFTEHYVDANYINQATIIPDGCVHLVICCHPEHPSANLCGNLYQGTEGLFIRQGCHYFSICFLPGYAEHFFKHPIGMFSGQEFPVHDVLPHAAILLSRVAGATNFEERITAFESFYIDYIKDELNINPLIQYATQRIIKSRGNLNIADLSNDCGYSTRYMVKIFEKYVGLSPKLFSRIMRFQYVVQALEVNEYPHILDHIYELGYCDQNHFIKDFKQFSRLTPKNYIHRLRS